MKKLTFAILSLLLVFSVSAQDAKQALKTAEKALKPFFKDPQGNADAAKAALEALEANFGTPEKGDLIIKKAKIYNKIADEEEKKGLLMPGYQAVFPEASLSAMEAYKMAYDHGEKKKDALKGLESSMVSINNLGITAFEAKDYTKSFAMYDKVTGIHDILKAEGKQSILDEEAAMSQHLFYTAVAGYYGGQTDGIKPYLMKLHSAKYDHAFVYEALYNINAEDNKEDAVKYLTEGRAAYPEDNGLLYAEINHYLTEGNLQEPISRIETAIAKDPENVSLYTTLGNVYDQLNTQEREAGNIEQADEYFDKAYTNFNKAQEIDPSNFDATYSVGALYYNKAASMTTEINELANDFSTEATKKYETMKAEMDGYFGEALPFFEKAHSLNEQDQNTIIALREIYARTNNFEKVNEMKAKLEAMGG